MTTSERPGCLVAFLGLFKGKATQAGPLPYRVRDDFLTKAEYSFYRVLEAVVGQRATVCPKVRLADIFYVARPNDNFSFFNRISQRHIDFLLCDPTSMRPLAGIELDDGSHTRQDRQERDDFVDMAFEAASLPLVRISVKRGYSPQELEARLAPMLTGQTMVADKSGPLSKTVSDKPSSATPICPKCGVPMVLRVASQGMNAGRQFYGCPNYPKCRQVLPIP